MKNKSFDFGNLLGVLLLVLFVAFKLAGIISWSWWWVLSPLWLMIAIPLIVFVVGMLIIFIKHMLDYKKKNELQ